MSFDNNSSVQSRVISAFFDTSGAAKKAVDDLVSAGIPREHISQTGGATAGEAVHTEAAAGDRKGFWQSLEDLFMPDDDRQVYSEGLSRGGYLIAVHADEANYNKVLDILDNDGAIDMDQRQNEWRSKGWTGFSDTGSSTATSGFGAASTSTGAGLALTGSRTDAVSSSSGIAAAPVAAAPIAAASATSGQAGTLSAGQDEVIPLYEERLNVGKRDVSHGRVRLRSYVVEQAVNEQVSLRDETVTIDRHPVDRPVSSTDALFQDRVIEAEERAEEAVISKDARVTEEISLRKTADTHVQNISDTVRRTEVEIEDARSGGTTGGSLGLSKFSPVTDSARIVEHMDVISADGQKVGTVDHLDGPDRIKMAKNTSPDGQHHWVPFAWIDHVDQHVHLKRTLAEIKADPAMNG